MSVFIFVASLPSMLWSYQPNVVWGMGRGGCRQGHFDACCGVGGHLQEALIQAQGGGASKQVCSCCVCVCCCPLQLSAAAFFFVASVGAVSVVASYLGILSAAGATATYTVVTMVTAQRMERIADAQRQGRLPPLAQGQSSRPHAE
jgi:hypothetical protein